MTQSKVKRDIKLGSNWVSLTDECVGILPILWVNIQLSSQDFHALKQHSKTQTYGNYQKAIHDKKNPKIAPVFWSVLKSQSPSPSANLKFQQPVLGTQSSCADSWNNAEMLWMLKVTSEDYSLGSLPNCFTTCLTVMLLWTMILVLVTIKYHTVSQIVLHPFF